MTTTLEQRMWHLMQVGESRIVRTLTVYQIQSQVSKVRKKHPECFAWRWRTKTQPDGSVKVWRVR